MDYFDIHSPEIQERLIIENDLAFTFPTRTPIVPGHTLICPKRPVKTWDELEDDEIDAIFDLRKKLRQAMKEVFDAEGFNYAWNEEEIGGQSVPHVHLHILPRKEGDAGIVEYEPRKFLYRPGVRDISPEEELTDVSKLLRDALV
jgi:histidine triad (HIT) family protein